MWLVPYHTTCQSGLPLLAFSLIVISSSECFFLMLCAFSGHPDKLVQWVINGRIKVGENIVIRSLSIYRCGCNRKPREREREKKGKSQRVDWWYCLEIKWTTGELTFCEWQTHCWHVQGRCSQVRDNGAVPVYWPSKQRAAHWWTTPSVFWQPVDNCLRCDGMCISPICGPVHHIQLLGTYQSSKQRNTRCKSTNAAGFALAESNLHK